MSSPAIRHGTQAVRADQARANPGIPRSALVVRAFDNPAEVRDRHPVLTVAAKLAAEHRIRAKANKLLHDPFADDHVVAGAARTVTARNTACAVLIEQIDVWAAAAFGESRAPVLHTESLGQLVDRLATVWTRAHLLAADDTPSARLGTRVARHQLGELSSAYDDLITDLRATRRRLPRYQTPTGPNAAL